MHTNGYFTGASCIILAIYDTYIFLILRVLIHPVIYSVVQVYYTYRILSTVSYCIKVRKQRKATRKHSRKIYKRITHQYDTNFTDNAKSLGEFLGAQNKDSGSRSAACRSMNLLLCYRLIAILQLVTPPTVCGLWVWSIVYVSRYTYVHILWDSPP